MDATTSYVMSNALLTPSRKGVFVVVALRLPAIMII
jgi:hypothetical protein